MTNLIFMLFAVLLLAGFLLVTREENRRGMRIGAERRARFDRDIERLVFIYTHVDFASYLRAEARQLAEKALHLVVHYTLQVVRSVERLLTTAVRELRSRVERHDDVRVLGEPRDFVKALSGFKRELVSTRPIVPEIQ